MKVLAVIPARYDSTRLHGKALVDIAGKPMIRWVWEAVTGTSGIDRAVIATDDARIVNTAEAFGAEAIMTSPSCKNGTERICEVVEKIPSSELPDFVLNIQGDEPLMTPDILGKFISALDQTKSPMATIIAKAEKSDIEDPSTVKVVVDVNFDALYFSRAPIPYIAKDTELLFYKHIGIYAYRPDILRILTKLPPSPLELAEKLEQLRALENGYSIHCVHIPSAKSLIGVDTPEDLEKVRKLLPPKGAAHDPS
ncbi:MAG: 3-deoxy-manno-octulosonate cytidylyltransferase [bacterium]